MSAPSPFGVAMNGGVGVYDGDNFGPWLEGGAYGHWALSGATYLRGDLSLAYASHSERETLAYHESTVDESNVDDLTLFAVLGRGTLGIHFSRVFAWELGGLVGPAFAGVDSVQCGEGSSSGVVFGAASGPALRLGSRVSAGIGLQLFFAPQQRCTNGGTNPSDPTQPWPRFHDDADGRLAVTMRIGYSL